MAIDCGHRLCGSMPDSIQEGEASRSDASLETTGDYCGVYKKTDTRADTQTYIQTDTRKDAQMPELQDTRAT